MSRPAIPAELIEVVLENLWDERSALLSCSLVNGNFYLAAQRHIFRSMWLKRRKDKPDLSSAVAKEACKSTLLPIASISTMAEIMAVSPHLGRHIRELTFDLPVREDEDGELTRILGTVSGVKRVAIAGVSLDWDSMSMYQESAILKLITASPSLDRLHFLGIVQLPRAVLAAAMRFARVLSFSGSLQDRDGDDDEPDVEPRLQTLILQDCSLEILQALPKAAALKKLACLPYSPTRTSHNPSAFLPYVPSTVTTLDIIIGSTQASPCLSNLPSLRSVTLRYDRGTRRYLPMRFAETLAQLPAVSLTVIFFTPISTPIDIWHDAAPLPVRGLDACLVEDIHFRLHAQVSPKLLKSGNKLTRLRESFRAALEAALPKFRLQFSFVMGDWSYAAELP
ncbi:hypothetical protein MIND_00001900 [Mycena indigotica]|uniref:Uncharacterized protein n=1 Tax=Mycena indigotica TaxID=2126181 RepID=A0A8H6WEJ7_9AGAR|nr:uncharacterized protein MIND_00001900 [Mycena indigotica]KAF7314882.1 hypothetical protein MIND_00001900 [Mycena indigotica]